MKMKNKKLSKKELADEFSARLKKIYPTAECALEYEGDPWRLLVMARLSAQCTDKRVNEVSRKLFLEIPTPQDAANISQERLEELIRSCGLFRTKAQSIRESAEKIVRDFGGEVPKTEEELLSLSGVGRKIANLILGDLYGKGGVVCDTHFIRICGRVGFYPEDMKTPEKAEKILNPLIEQSERADFCHRVVLFGREYCGARSYTCASCPMLDICRHGQNK
jgi:endonuclease-3